MMESKVSIIEDIIRSYPELAEKMRCLRLSPKLTQRGGKIHSDPTADAALVELPPEQQRRYDAVNRALRHTRIKYQNGRERIRVIRLLYWSSRDSQADLENCSALTVQEYRQDFIRAVTEYLGLNHCEGCVYWRKFLDTRRGCGCACHYCYDTGKLRSHDGTRCYSKSLDLEQSKSVVYTVTIPAGA